MSENNGNPKSNSNPKTFPEGKSKTPQPFAGRRVS